MSSFLLFIVWTVRYGANADRPNNDGAWPLHYFAKRAKLESELLPDYSKTFNALLEHGADINKMNRLVTIINMSMQIFFYINTC